MKNIFKPFILILIAILSVNAYGQQAPHFTQFMYNMNVVNPAYAGIKNGLSVVSDPMGRSRRTSRFPDRKHSLAP